MPLHHYLPATYLANFSSETGKPRRARQIVVGDKRNKRIFNSAVGKAAGIQNLYSLISTADPNIIEITWSLYEEKLKKAINALISGNVDATTWIRILVPFVTSLFVRTTDFNIRFEARLQELGVNDNNLPLSKDNTNSARLLELQRLLGPVLAAKWLVLKTSGPKPLITNDIGFAPFINYLVDEHGIAIPLSLDHILVLVPKRERKVFHVRGGILEPIIEYTDLFPNNHLQLNETLAGSANRFIFGSERALISRLVKNAGPAKRSIEPVEIGFIGGRHAVAHEFTWHRLAAAVAKHKHNSGVLDFSLDWESVASDWVPPVILPFNLPQFPSAVYLDGSDVTVSFFDIPGFTDNLSRQEETNNADEDGVT